jgi:type IV pilus assembly protein PilC
VITDVTREVESGSTLSDALGKHKVVFDDLFRNMVAAGEAGGVLDEILMRLATYIEKADALKRKVQSAMVYPAVVLTVALGATAFMLIFIIPTFAKMFTDFGGELPLPTQIVLWLSSALQRFWWVGLLAMGTSAFLLQRYYATDNGRAHRRDHAPAAGARRRALSSGRGRALHADAQYAGSSRCAHPRGTRDHRAHRREQDHRRGDHDGARASIREGETVSAPLKQSGVFPPMVVQMISVGEQTGALDERCSPRSRCSTSRRWTRPWTRSPPSSSP